MIVAHCFLREIRKGEWYLMCEATATDGLASPFPRPEVVLEVELDGDRSKWAGQVKERILAVRPDLEFVHVLTPEGPSRGRPPAFDLVFKEKET